MSRLSRDARSRMVAVLALRRGDGRPRYPMTYVAALFGVTVGRVSQVVKECSIVREGKSEQRPGDPMRRWLT